MAFGVDGAESAPDVVVLPPVVAGTSTSVSSWPVPPEE
jgi:hypothetical protein